jgi:hypothetical protein
MYWTNARTYEYHFAEFPGTQVDFRHLVGDKYPSIRYIQLLMVPLDHFPVGPAVDPSPSPIAPIASVDIGTPRLSAIPEENESDVSSLDTAILAMFGDVTEESKEPLLLMTKTILDEPPQPKMETKEHLESDVTLKEYWCGNILDEDHDGYPCMQLYLDDNLAKEYFGMIYDDDQQAILQIYATSAKTTVIKRDTDILTKEEKKDPLEGTPSGYA